MMDATEAVLCNLDLAKAAGRAAGAMFEQGKLPDGHEDAFQEAALYMTRRAGEWKGVGDIRHFVRDGAKSVALRAVHRKGHIKGPTKADPEKTPSMMMPGDRSMSRMVDERHMERERRIELRDALERLLGQLPEQDSLVLRQLFGFDGVQRTPAEIANAAGITVDKVYDIRARAIGRLRKMGAKRQLKDFKGDM